MRSLDADRLQDVISSLEIYEDRFAPEQVVPGTIVLMNLLPDLPQRIRGMFELDTTMVVTRVTYRLLRSLKAPERTEAAVRAILPELTTLSAKLNVITQVGHREGAGHRLIAQESDQALLLAWRDEVRQASAAQLLREWDLLRVLHCAKFEADSSEPLFDVPDAPLLTLALLRASKSESRRQSVDSRAVRRSLRLAWEVLVKLCGGEDELRRRIDALAATDLADEGDRVLIQLAGRYLGGWRPSEFGDDDE